VVLLGIPAVGVVLPAPLPFAVLDAPLGEPPTGVVGLPLAAVEFAV